MDKIIGFIIEKIIFLGRIFNETENEYIVRDVVIVQILATQQGALVSMISNFIEEMSLSKKNVIVFKPAQNLIDIYTREIAKQKGIEIPEYKDFKLTKST